MKAPGIFQRNSGPSQRSQKNVDHLQMAEIPCLLRFGIRYTQVLINNTRRIQRLAGRIRFLGESFIEFQLGGLKIAGAALIAETLPDIASYPKLQLS